jgi:hypothetical protein
MEDKLVHAAISEIPRFVSALILLGLAWLVTQRVSVFWNLRQKQKENDLSTARDFHAIYGEFFAIWKLWNYYVRDVPDLKILPDASRWTLLDRACIAEGKLETMLVRLVSEKELQPEDVKMLERAPKIAALIAGGVKVDSEKLFGITSNEHEVWCHNLGR